MVLPQFLAPQITATGGGEVTESYAIESAASDHSSGMYMSGDGLSGSNSEGMT